MNESIICRYYKAIKTAATNYRKSMFMYWKELFPDSKFTEQRICDQKRLLAERAEQPGNSRGNLLTTLEIDIIRQEVNILFDGKNDNTQNEQGVGNDNMFKLSMDEETTNKTHNIKEV